MAELLDRARLLVVAGPHAGNAAERAAVHALIYPSRDPVCQDCRHELGAAFYAIKRWVDQQHASSTSLTSSNVKKHSTARFHSDQLIYTPHGLGVAYSNDNLTDKAARDILKADPDAAQHFAVLPPAAEADEDEQPLTPAQASAEKQAEKAQHPTPAAPADFDYAKLARALADEMEHRAKASTTPPAPAPAEQPALTASVGGAAEGDAPTEVTTETLGNGVEVTTGQPDTAHDDEQPVRLSRMDKKQLVATYQAELNMEPAAGLTNDQLRDAIADHRAASAQ